jgi:hypothetical protein
MTSRGDKAVREGFWAFLILFGIVLEDLSHFFPLADRSNFRFQAIGELLELIALTFLIVLLRVFGKEDSDPMTPSSPLRRRFILAGYLSVFLLTVFWRDFFPNDAFNLSAGAIDFLYAPLGGLGMVALSYVSQPKRGKPSKEEERSVV